MDKRMKREAKRAKHEWKDTSSNARPFRRFRQCVKCGVEQEFITEHLWMRVTGYKWRPLVGLCKGSPSNRSKS